MHLARIAEYENQQITQFVVWILRNVGIQAQAQPLIGQDYSKEPVAIDYKPEWAVVVPHKDERYADLVLEVLTEFNWSGKESDKKILPAFLKELKKRLNI